MESIICGNKPYSSEVIKFLKIIIMLRSKILSENFIKNNLENFLIIRTNFFEHGVVRTNLF